MPENIIELKNTIKELTVGEVEVVSGGGTSSGVGGIGPDSGGSGPTNPCPRPPLFPSD
jgi:hypothetical protein